jgi:hypothetical protein
LPFERRDRMMLGMFFLVSGSSGAGKTTTGPLVRAWMEDLVYHDADENLGEPLEFWVERGLAYEESGRDLLLSTSRPLGELLACREAINLSAIAGCLLDCDDLTRAERLRSRPPPRDRILSMDILCWASWHRMHADDPCWSQHTITGNGTDREWARWTGWRRGDPRWWVPVFDTSIEGPQETAGRLAAWIATARRSPPLSRASEWWRPGGGGRGSP